MKIPRDEILHITAEGVGTLKAEWRGELIRCKDCKHRVVNEHYGEKGYMKLKAYCDLDTGDIFELGRCAEDDYWFCADAEKRYRGKRK